MRVTVEATEVALEGRFQNYEMDVVQDALVPLRMVPASRDMIA